MGGHEHVSIAMHRLPRGDFAALAAGGGGPTTVALLRRAQRSKHILLLHSVLEAAARRMPAAFAELELAACWRLLAAAQERAPEAVAEVLMLPQLGAWALDTLQRLTVVGGADPSGGADRPGGADPRVRADLAQFGAIAAVAALRAGLPFDLPVPLRDGRLVLPGLGPLPNLLPIALPSDQVRLRLSATGLTLLTHGSAYPLPSSWPPPWRLISSHAGLALDVGLDATDPYLDRYAHPLLTDTDERTLAAWAQRFAGAWRILAVHHRRDAEAIAAGLHTVIPLAAERDTHTVAATSPAAFGAMATSLPPDAVTLAETLVHEFQHLKLCALLDLLPLVEAGHDELRYAPWRDDPRPLHGLLQGAYAYLGVTRFWSVQRLRLPDEQALRGHVEFARRRAETLAVTGALLASGGLTETGARFVSGMRARLVGWQTQRVPAEAGRLAREVSANHKVTWRLRHEVPDPEHVDQLVARWRAGARPDRGLLTLPVATRVRARGHYAPHPRTTLLTLRYTDQPRFSAYLAGGCRAEPGGLPKASAGDRALLRGDLAAAVAAYRQEIRCGGGQPDPWAGLAVAARGLTPCTASRAVLARTPLLFAVHGGIRAATGISVDPLDLAAWLTGRGLTARQRGDGTAATHASGRGVAVPGGSQLPWLARGPAAPSPCGARPVAELASGAAARDLT